MENNLVVPKSVSLGQKLHNLGNFQIHTSLDDLLEVNHNVVQISNIPGGISEHRLKTFLETKRMSGGGEIQQLTYQEDSKVARVKFRSVQGKKTMALLLSIYASGRRIRNTTQQTVGVFI